MASPNYREVNDGNFEAEVLQCPIPVMVHFTATWCGPCRALAPVVEKIADDFQGKLKVCKLDIDESPEVARKYGVRSVPMVVVYQHGQKTASQAGLTFRDALLKLVGFN